MKCACGARELAPGEEATGGCKCGGRHGGHGHGHRHGHGHGGGCGCGGGAKAKSPVADLSEGRTQLGLRSAR